MMSSFGLAIRDDPKPGPFFKSFAFAERERSLPTVGPVDVFFTRHVLRALIGILKTLQSGVVHFLFSSSSHRRGQEHSR